MKNLYFIIIFFLLFSCKKENTTTPPATTNNVSHTVEVDSQFPTNVQVTINGVNQNIITGGVQTYSLVTGDIIIITGNGQDTTLLDGQGNVIGYTQGHIDLTVKKDGIIVYSMHCDCDGYYTMTIN